MVHLSDLDWKRPGEQVIEEYKKGDKVRAQVLDVDVEKERISLGIKQLEADPFAEPGDLKRGAVVTARVTQFDKKARKVGVSIKALEVAEEKEAIAQFGSSDSGATLGDILGTALRQRATADKE